MDDHGCKIGWVQNGVYPSKSNDVLNWSYTSSLLGGGRSEFFPPRPSTVIGRPSLAPRTGLLRQPVRGSVLRGGFSELRKDW
jgi:hypothetical protein